MGAIFAHSCAVRLLSPVMNQELQCGSKPNSLITQKCPAFDSRADFPLESQIPRVSCLWVFILYFFFLSLSLSLNLFLSLSLALSLTLNALRLKGFFIYIYFLSHSCHVQALSIKISTPLSHADDNYSTLSHYQEFETPIPVVSFFLLF